MSGRLLAKKVLLHILVYIRQGLWVKMFTPIRIAVISSELIERLSSSLSLVTDYYR